MAEGLVLDGDLHTGGNRNLRGWFYRLCTGTASTLFKIYLGWCGASSLMVLAFSFLRDLLIILSASEDNRSFMGRSDVVYCVRVPLTGTTVAEFRASRSLVGIGLCTVPYSCVQYCGLFGPLYHCYI